MELRIKDEGDGFFTVMIGQTTIMSIFKYSNKGVVFRAEPGLKVQPYSEHSDEIFIIPFPDGEPKF